MLLEILKLIIQLGLVTYITKMVLLKKTKNTSKH